ncbi:MAG: hypothetical protein AB7S39_13180 [Gemmatimonadales bacterium]
MSDASFAPDGSAQVTAFPPELAGALREAGLADAGAVIREFIESNRLICAPTDAPVIASYQVALRLGKRVHPVISLQPPPNNPDIPFQKMRGLSWSEFGNKGSRRWIVDKLNSVVPEDDRKSYDVAEKMYKIRWSLFSEEGSGPALIEVLQLFVDRVRQRA